MKNNELKNHVLAVLDRLGKSTAQEVVDHIEGSPALIQVHKVLSQLKGSGLIEETKIDRVKYYSLNVNLQKEHKLNSRDMSRFRFDGVKNLSKGRLVLAVVQKFVKESNPSYRQLKQVFPDDIVKPYGVVQDMSKAKELSPDPKRKRYFLNEQDVIILSRGKVKRVVVTNQWTTERFRPFLDLVGELGYIIEPGEG